MENRHLYFKLKKIYEFLSNPETMHQGFYELGQLTQDVLIEVLNTDNIEEKTSCDCDCHEE